MISGVCHCGHSGTAIHDRKDVIKFASDHGHFPKSVKLTCSCGAEFAVGPSNATLPAELSVEETINFVIRDATLTFLSLDRWLLEHQQHSDMVM